MNSVTRIIDDERIENVAATIVLSREHFVERDYSSLTIYAIDTISCLILLTGLAWLTIIPFTTTAAPRRGGKET